MPRQAVAPRMNHEQAGKLFAAPIADDARVALYWGGEHKIWGLGWCFLVLTAARMGGFCDNTVAGPSPVGLDSCSSQPQTWDRSDENPS